MMDAPSSDPWIVLDYETDMFLAMWSLLRPDHHGHAILDLQIRNAVVESALLHVRQLSEILLSRGKRRDDINLSSLLPGFRPTRLDELDVTYGKSDEAGTPCWTINKRLAHPTSVRGSSYDYTDLFNQLAPLLGDITRQVRAERGDSCSPVPRRESAPPQRRWTMRFFDGFSLAQKIVMIVVLVGVVLTLLLPPKSGIPYTDYSVYTNEPSTSYRYEVGAVALAALILAELLGGVVIVGTIGLVRGERAKRQWDRTMAPRRRRLWRQMNGGTEPHLEPEKPEDETSDGYEFECSECGAAVVEDAQVCPQCGADLSELDDSET